MTTARVEKLKEIDEKLQEVDKNVKENGEKLTEILKWISKQQKSSGASDN